MKMVSPKVLSLVLFQQLAQDSKCPALLNSSLHARVKQSLKCAFSPPEALFTKVDNCSLSSVCKGEPLQLR